MRFVPAIACLFLLAACNAPAGVPSSLSDNPHTRTVNIDDHTIYVLGEGHNHYAAWGGETDKDGFVQYRQKRGIELVSQCRVEKVTSTKTDVVLRALVKC